MFKECNECGHPNDDDSTCCKECGSTDLSPIDNESWILDDIAWTQYLYNREESVN